MSARIEVFTQDPKERLLIEELDDAAVQICDEMRQTGKKLEDSYFSASSSTKVRPRALVKRLEEFNNLCDSKKLKNDIQGIIEIIKNMYCDGGTRMFVFHDNKEDGSKLEFVCGVVHIYKFKGGEPCGTCTACKKCKSLISCGRCEECEACDEPLNCRQCEKCKAGHKCEKIIPCERCRACKLCRTPVSCGRCEECRKCEGSVACNYLLSTSSYKEKVNRAGLNAFIEVVAGGIIAGAVGLATWIAIGNLGLLSVGGLALVACLGASRFDSGFICKSTDTTIKAEFNNILKASFVYELIVTGFAEIVDGKLYLKLDD